MVVRRSPALEQKVIIVFCFAGLFLVGLLAQEAAVVARMAGFACHHHQKTEAAVVSAATDAAATAEMHQMRMERMTMVMTPIAEIAIPAKGKTSLNPNSLHIMLFGLKSRPANGDVINLTLKLDDGSTVPVMATVRK